MNAEPSVDVAVDVGPEGSRLHIADNERAREFVRALEEMSGFVVNDVFGFGRMTLPPGWIARATIEADGALRLHVYASADAAARGLAKFVALAPMLPMAAGMVAGMIESAEP